MISAKIYLITIKQILVDRGATPVSPFGFLRRITNEGEFDWDEHTQGLILGAFFYGFILTNIPGGILANYFGGKIVVGVSIFLTGILTLFSPLAARSSGIVFSGIFYPGMNILIGSWYPKMERSKFASYIFAGK
ncbi:Sialin [Armadillidium nasatum]|uniref:Sialin n=1 Tax=Armadillidium nasatum TaxID=96803 RepID=A0A5N5SLR9_9CRUS|nr:Sialin [Armadillidium nasatum]